MNGVTLRILEITWTENKSFIFSLVPARQDQSEAHLGPPQTSRMKSFATKINCF